MELFCCDEASMRKVLEIDIKNLPSNTNVKVTMGSAFEPMDTGWVVIPPMAQMVGDIAVINVSGAMVAGAAGWRRLFGAIGYEDIKSAVVEAVGKSEVNGIMMYYDTPGGSVNGLKQTADLLRQVGKIKPMNAYAAQAASAGYWLASSSGKIFSDDMNLIGSIGTIMQTVDYTKANENEGIKFHIFKSGALKMAGNPNEPLSDEAKAHFQELVDDMTAVFYKAVAQGRGGNAATLRQTFGDGRVMTAPRALAGGLIDGLGGTAAALSDLRSRITSTKSKGK